MMKSLRGTASGQPFLFALPAMDFPFDVKEAALLLPGVVHFALHGPGHGISLDVASCEGVVVFAPLTGAREEKELDGPHWDALRRVLGEFGDNRTVPALLVIFLAASQANGVCAPAQHYVDLLCGAMKAGADHALFSFPDAPVSHRQLHLECESAKVKVRQLAEAREAYMQSTDRRCNALMRAQIWKSPGGVLSHIPLEDPRVAEREQGFGDTVFTKLLGEGACAKVYRATHHVHGPVAVKVVRKSKIRDLAGLAQLDREIAVLRDMRAHPNIVQLHECVHAASRLYIIFSYLGDHSLHQYVSIRQAGASRNPLAFPAEEAFKLLSHIVKGCHHCHAHSICHRDLKLQNCMVSADGAVVLIDFGLATTVPLGRKLGTPCGTVPYAAPEVMLCSPKSPCDGYAGDVWSLAVVAVELLCGLGTTVRIVGLAPQDVCNFDHIASCCRALSEEEKLTTISHRLGQDMARGTRAEARSTLAGMLAPSSEHRFRISDVALAAPISRYIFPAVDSLGSHPQCVRSASKASTDADAGAARHASCPGEGRLARDRARATQPAEGEGASLLESFGGAWVVKKAVGIHYDSLLRRPEFAQFFLGSPFRMAHIRAGIETVLTQLLSDPASCDLEMLRRVHRGHWISDYLFCEWVDTICQTFEALGVGPRCIACFVSVIDRVRGPVVGGFRESLVAARRGHGALEEQLAAVGLAAPGLAQRLEEQCAGAPVAQVGGLLLDMGEVSGLLLGAKFRQLGAALRDGGVTAAHLPMLCKCLAQTLHSAGLAPEARDSALIQTIDAVQGAALASCAGIPARVAEAGEDDTQWFVATMSQLVKADGALQPVSGRPKMSRCLRSIFSGISCGSAALSTSSLIEIHKSVVITDSIFTRVLAHVNKILGVAFPFPTHSASVRNRAIRMLGACRSHIVNSCSYDGAVGGEVCSGARAELIPQQ